MGWQLCWKTESQVLHSLPSLCLGKNAPIKLGLAMIWICILIDYFQNWKYIAKSESEVAFGLILIAGFGAFLLFLPIATLFITQLMCASSNITTL